MSFLDLLSRVAEYADDANASYERHRDVYDRNGLSNYNRSYNSAQRLGRNAARLDTIRTMSDQQIKEIIQDSSASSFDRRAALKVYRERKGSQSSSD